ncbi:hypothetical protein CMUS01_11069 [Colletotrichum musicola]|uniref:Uncharacterized protein n=1 Tax=Colletotrichum musicola TaxID=2175873 RepID=A0A8H6K036_9PEZI|nr:hypothetical protein CMUS01_11069 [Colletotrichum musicola]
MPLQKESKLTFAAEKAVSDSAWREESMAAGTVLFLAGSYKTLPSFHNSGLPVSSRPLVPFLPPEPSHYPFAPR